MRRFLSLNFGASNFSQKLKNTSNSTLELQLSHQQPGKRIFSTVTNQTPSSSNSNSNAVFSRKAVGFFSNPWLRNQFMSNFTKTLSDRKLGFFTLRFCRGFNSMMTPRDYMERMRGRRSWFNQLSDDNVLFGLILANVVVFLSWRVLDKKFMSQNFMISLDNFKSGRVHTLLTSAFSHIDMEHIVSNMIGLYFFGTSIGRTFGPEYLLKLYVAGAIGGSVFYLVHHAYMALSTKGNGMWMKDPSRTPALGASGAVNAIILLAIFLNPRATLYFDFIIPVPAILLGIFLIGKDTLRIVEGSSDISGSAHLGGAAVAAIAYARIRRGRF